MENSEVGKNEKSGEKQRVSVIIKLKNGIALKTELTFDKNEIKKRLVRAMREDVIAIGDYIVYREEVSFIKVE